MSKRKLIIKLKHSNQRHQSADQAMMSMDLGLDSKATPKFEHCDLDKGFPITEIPGVIPTTSSESNDFNIYDTDPGFVVSNDPKHSSYIVRGEVDEKDLEKFLKEADANRSVEGVFADVTIDTMITCGSSPGVGTDTDVENLLGVSRMKRCKMDGKGVYVAIVDSGINMARLNSEGKHPQFDAARSFSVTGAAPGAAAVGHGTMCAFDACIAAPRCTLLDIAILKPGNLQSVLSDAVLAYRHLINVFRALKRSGKPVSLVVNNSWGMFHPSWDFPVGHPGNYSDNPNHPFNIIVRTLDREGADILFAAGNCGSECPDNRCGNAPDNGIYGANSSPYVLSVAGADINKNRVGYSNRGPGRLTQKKPDITGYTHFVGSGVYAADSGTSAACPVVAGVVAAVRSKRPYNGSGSTIPSAIRDLLRSTAEDRGASGYDLEYGHGIVNGKALVSKLCPRPTHWFCIRYPHLCRHLYLCKKYPWLCNKLKWPYPRIPGVPRVPEIPRIPGESGPTEGLGQFSAADDGGDWMDIFADISEEDLHLLAGLMDQDASGPSAPGESDCGCKH